MISKERPPSILNSSTVLTKRSNTVARAISVNKGFPPNYRWCVLSSDVAGMNHGTEARLPDGSGAMPSVNQLGLDFARTMP